MSGRVDIGVGEARRPRGPGVVYSSLSVVLIVLVGIVALTATQPPPPTIAEFAPQALEVIDEAPSEQTSDFGTGGGGEGGGGFAVDPVTGELVPRATPPPIEVTRVRKCIGDPPRQIEDPQSPPCVPYWAGDNGGATTKGVTRDSIVVALPHSKATGFGTFVSFFNSRFEFYGRKLRGAGYEARGGTPAEMEDDARMVDEDVGAFANLGYNSDQNGREVNFYDALARRKVISIQFPSHAGTTPTDEAHFEKFSPYQWNYLPSIDKILANMGEFTCASLAGRRPEYAGAPESLAEVRKFGVIYQSYSDGTPSPDLSPLRAATSVCGVRFVEIPAEGNAASATNAILQAKQAGVTSLMCLCNKIPLAQNYMPSASAQSYFPEWLISNYGVQDDDLAGQGFPPDQSAHMFGLMGFNKWVPEPDMPHYWATMEIEHSQQWTFDAERWALYWNLLTLSSGIQMAGPNLTPETFEEGLFKARFPNPGCGAQPYFQACVGFGPLNRTMIQDFALVWWSQSEESVQTPSGARGKKGAYCYVRGGQRYSSGTWPREDPPLFKPPCR